MTGPQNFRSFHSFIFIVSDTIYLDDYGVYIHILGFGLDPGTFWIFTGSAKHFMNLPCIYSIYKYLLRLDLVLRGIFRDNIDSENKQRTLSGQGIRFVFFSGVQKHSDTDCIIT